MFRVPSISGLFKWRQFEPEVILLKEPSFHTTLRRGQVICAPTFGLCQGGGQSRLVLACIVYLQAWEISWILRKSRYNPSPTLAPSPRDFNGTAARVLRVGRKRGKRYAAAARMKPPSTSFFSVVDFVSGFVSAAG